MDICRLTDKERRLSKKKITDRYAHGSRIAAACISVCIIITAVCGSCARGSEEEATDSAVVTAAGAKVSSNSSEKGKSGDESSKIRSGSDSKKEEADSKPPKPVWSDLSDLQAQINDAVDSYYGNWSVYLKELDSGITISVNDSQFYAASEIKLFAMAAAYQQISEGLIDEEDIYDTIYRMIAFSSNDDFNSIVRTVGLYYITDWCIDNEYDNTIQCHGLYPSSNGDGLQTYYGYNLTTAKDLGRLLESIYRKECISEEYSQKMIDILLEQTFLTKIPAGIPEGVMVANKTGETEDVCHDAAIVYSDNADYILTVMVDAPGNAWSCEGNVANLSEIVYRYFNG